MKKSSLIVLAALAGAACSAPEGNTGYAADSTAAAATAASASGSASDTADQAIKPGPQAEAQPIRAAAISPGRTQCRGIIGWLIDPAPEGRNIRRGPSVSSEQIGVILPPMTGSDFDVPAEFEVIGSENGWLRIRGARFDETLVGRTAPRMFTGEGWISGRGVRVVLQTRAAFVAPSHDAAVLIDGRPEAHLDGLQQRGIAGCQGQWVLVDWTEPRAAFEGQALPRWHDDAIISRDPLILRAWGAGVCNIIETTCDGIDGTTAQSAFRD